MEFAVILALAILVMILGVVCLILARRFAHIKSRLQTISSTLDAISAGDLNRKILAPTYDTAATICYQINEIVCQYQDRLIELEKEADTNKQLMTSLSHDVRTPLTTLIGYLDAIHKGMVVGTEREDYIEIARKKAHDMKEYIDVLFDWFKLNSNEETFSIAPRELAELTRSILKDWIPIFEERSLDYEISIPQSRITVAIDPDAYTRIVNNLIQNVLTHSDASRIEIVVAERAGKAEINVVDNGVGIPAEDAKHIFERLYKCDKGRSQKGSGLGLNIVWQLVEKMGGTISVSSKQGTRTAFTVALPLVK